MGQNFKKTHHQDPIEEDRDVNYKEIGEPDKEVGEKKVRINDHVESKDLWKLRRCLRRNGYSVLSGEYPKEIIQLGLGEIKIKRLGLRLSYFDLRI
ncbi:hypothetical protein V6N13_133832 [Hibiscus sabdariffa]